MATIGLRRIEVVKTITGNAPRLFTYPEAAGTQTFTTGDPVYLDSSGRVAARSTYGGASNTLIGIAAAPATGVAGTDIPIWIADDDTLFVANLCNNQTQIASSWSDVTRTYGIIKNVAAAVWAVDKANTNGRALIVVDLDRRDGLPSTAGTPSTGDVGARVHFQFIPGVTQLYATS